jgi:hypothetical protein
MEISSARFDKPMWILEPVKFFIISLKIKIGYKVEGCHWFGA